ncbi:MAG: arginine--tRNA ligase [Acidobacteria bacterium]|nr:arginine--tRNA ligase [Acidobacteriota bacterium]
MLAALRQEIEDALKEAVQQTCGVTYESLNFTVPPRIELGEIASPLAFDLARKVRRRPRELAQSLAEAVARVPGVESAEVAGGGYLNIHLDRGRFACAFADSLEKGESGAGARGQGRGKIIVEHTNINPNKAAHIGHLRNAALGDSFVRCLRFLGETVEVQNYLDNTGVQVADVVVGLERMLGMSLQEIEQVDGKFDYFCWDVYARVADFYRKSEDNQKLRSRTLQAVEAGNNPAADIAEHVAMRIVRAHLATMARINVHYDLLPRESDILHLRFWEKAFALLKERQAIHFVEEGKNRGCWVMKTGERSDADRREESSEEDEKIIVRSDGTVTYVGKDIAYQLWKFGLLGLDFRYRTFDHPPREPLWMTTTDVVPDAKPPQFGRARRVYNVIDSRQSYLQSVVVQGLRALGFEEQAASSTHFSYEMVALSPACCEELGFRLSEEDKKRPYLEVAGRKGLGVKADDLLDALEQKALGEVRARHSLPPAQAEEIARIIAVAALRYFLLRFARNTVITFDFREALSFDGETGPYVQYAVVRANNIFRKLAESGEDRAPAASEVDPERFGGFLKQNDEIWDLVYFAARLPETAQQAVQSLEISQVAKYAFQLAQRFNLFYHKYHILSETDRERKRHLLMAAAILRAQLTRALDLLGIGVPPMM